MQRLSNRDDGCERHSSRTPKRLLIQENARVPTPMTVHVATVRHRASVPVNSQMARIDAPTAMKMQIAVIQNENEVTRRGLRKPCVFGPLRPFASLSG